MGTLELLSFDATPGAAKTINEWISCGHEVSIITGRPSSVYEPSRIWLDEHGLKNARLYCLNKYGRDHFISGIICFGAAAAFTSSANVYRERAKKEKQEEVDDN